jgi:hypothetical protein
MPASTPWPTFFFHAEEIKDTGAFLFALNRLLPSDIVVKASTKRFRIPSTPGILLVAKSIATNSPMANAILSKKNCGLSSSGGTLIRRL